MYTIKLPDRKIRNSLHNYLLDKRIFSKIYFEPIHLTDFYRQKFGIKDGALPITEKIAQCILTIPIYPNMTMEEKTYLVESISDFFE